MVQVRDSGCHRIAEVGQREEAKGVMQGIHRPLQDQFLELIETLFAQSPRDELPDLPLRGQLTYQSGGGLGYSDRTLRRLHFNLTDGRGFVPSYPLPRPA